VSTKKTDVLVIGGGLLGLSTAMHLQAMRPSLSIMLIEKDEQLAAQQSGHNSGVIHAGIYYEPKSLKARFCVEGHRALLKFCAQHGIPVAKCGKVIVASTDEEIDRLERLHDRGVQNGVPGLSMIDQRELQEVEPNVAGARALYAPHSAVVDYKKIAAAYAGIFRAGGGSIKLETELLSAQQVRSLSRVETTAGEIEARFIINCAGLHADLVAKKTGTKPGLRIIPFSRCAPDAWSRRFGDGWSERCPGDQTRRLLLAGLCVRGPGLNSVLRRILVAARALLETRARGDKPLAA